MEGLLWREEEEKQYQNLTLEEQVASIQAEIDNLAENMKDAKARKKELQGQDFREGKRRCVPCIYTIWKNTGRFKGPVGRKITFY